jgi:hypothetical protein
MKNILVIIGIILIIGAGYLAYTHKAAPQPADTSTHTYTGAGFTINYPDGWTVDPSYTYTALGPGKDIPGVSFTIPASLAAGTNLSPDSYLSVEHFPTGMACADASSTDAAAGNRYEEWVYATPVTDGCLGVRYFIHYGVFENYPAGAVREFDHTSLVAQFDAIRHTLVVSK